MIFSVPQYINVEDKIAGPLTAKQFLWMLGLGAVLIVLWNSPITKTAFYAFSVPIVLIFGALAFYRPQGMPLIVFIGHAITFFLQPKVYVWRRMANAQRTHVPQKAVKAYETQFYTASRTDDLAQDFAALAATLDSEGAEATERFMEITRKADTKNK